MSDNSRTDNGNSIQEQLWAEPDNISPEMQEQISASAELTGELEQARAFNSRLTAAIDSTSAPQGGLERALLIPGQAANDDSFLRRMLPVAAVLLVSISLGLYFQPEANASLAQDIFGHIYFEEPYLGDGSAIAADEVHTRMNSVFGTHMKSPDGEEDFEFTFAKDCYIAKQVAMHLVVKGETGPVNLMMIPEQMVSNEVRIADQRFNGMVTPASGGTLVVVGNKREHLDIYRDRFAHSLEWKY